MDCKLVIFTDLDGTLLDKESYDAGPAEAALEACRRHLVPVVFVSSKTRGEIVILQRTLGNSCPFVSENGCGIFLPSSEFARPEGAEVLGEFWSIALGRPYRELTAALAAAAVEVGAEVKGFADLDIAGVMQLTGLSEDGAKAAKQRDFDEPFVILNDNEKLSKNLIQAIRAQGYRCTRGGRFYHITGDCHKGEAIARLQKIYNKISPTTRFAALGDAPNDIPMLLQVDFPFVVRHPDGAYMKEALEYNFTITSAIGPAGFSEAVFGLLRKSMTSG